MASVWAALAHWGCPCAVDVAVFVACTTVPGVTPPPAVTTNCFQIVAVSLKGGLPANGGALSSSHGAIGTIKFQLHTSLLNFWSFETVGF